MSLSSKPLAAEAAASIEPLDRLAERVLVRIIPFFHPIPPVDHAIARQAAADRLFAHGFATGQELQLAAQITVLGTAALACLRAAMSVPGMPIPAYLRMCEDATKMLALSEQHSRALTAIQQAGAIGGAYNEAAFNATVRFARERVDYARTQVEALKVAGDLAAKRAGTAKLMKKAARPRDKAMNVAWVDALEALMRTAG
jgi:hypothetical protein